MFVRPKTISITLQNKTTSSWFLWTTRRSAFWVSSIRNHHGSLGPRQKPKNFLHRAKSTLAIPHTNKISLKEYPFACQLVIATIKTSAADVVVQTTVEKKSLQEIDLRRNFTFLLFGLTYLGGFQYWLLIHKYKKWFPTMKRFGNKSLSNKLRDKAGLIDAAKMVAFDVIIHAPIIYFPTYYTVKEFIGGTKWNPLEWIQDGLHKYKKNMKEDLIAMAKVTIPSDCIQVVMPLHTRMLFRHLVSFFWTAYISFSRGAMEEGDDDAVPKTSPAGVSK